MPAIKAIAGPKALTPEWQALRLYDPNRKDRPVVFGASVAAQACDASKWGSSLELFLTMRGRLNRERTQDELHRMEMGQRLEPVILDLYEQRMDCRLVRDQHALFSPDHEFMSATPDGLAITDDPKNVDWAVDAKAAMQQRYDSSGEDDDKYGIEGTDQVPMDAMFQAQQQMAVTGLDRVDFPVLFGGHLMRIYTVHRNDDLIEQIVSAERELARKIIADEQPEPNYRHPGTGRLLEKMFGYSKDKEVTLPAEFKEFIVALQEARVAKKEAEAAEDEAKVRLGHAAGDAEVIRCEGSSLVLTRRKNRPTFFTQAHIDELEAELADAKARLGLMKRDGARVWRITKK